MASSKKASPSPLPDRAGGQWLVAAYAPVTLFSLRMTHATSKGGKTLLVPTPYAVKMALLDACFRRWGPGEAENNARALFEAIKARAVRIRPPGHCVVQNTFIKVLDQAREKGAGPFRRTIAYREFVYYEGRMEVAIACAGMASQEIDSVRELLAHLNTFGKRGSFFQYLGCEVVEGTLGDGYSAELASGEMDYPASYAVVQALDDFGDALCRARDGFERVSTYGGGGITLDEHRVLRLTALPYRRRSASRHFTWYERGNTP